MSENKDNKFNLSKVVMIAVVTTVLGGMLYYSNPEPVVIILGIPVYLWCVYLFAGGKKKD